VLYSNIWEREYIRAGLTSTTSDPRSLCSWHSVIAHPLTPMPSLVNSKPLLKPWSRPKETTASLDWAPLAVIDLSTFDTEGGKELLSKALKDALQKWGFWVVTGTGIPQEQIDRQLSIANAFFKLSLEEKRKVSCDFSVGKLVAYPTWLARVSS
jgi:hypothetical protein